MFSGVRSRFSYANVVATLALVFAMSGGALAASKYLITSPKQIKPSVLKSLKGKTGPAGAVGAAGPAGAIGPAGPGGAQGPAGPQGPAGENGAPGVEGKAGKNGATGSPWTAGGVLPSGKSETGTWTFSETVPTGTNTASVVWASISFPIPLAAPIVESKTHIFSDSEPAPTGCKVTSGFLETTESETLCIMVASSVGASVPAAKLNAFNLETVAVGAGRSGVALNGSSLPEGTTGFGTWVVTG
jgi:hypothetical protein